MIKKNVKKNMPEIRKMLVINWGPKKTILPEKDVFCLNLDRSQIAYNRDKN